MIAANSDCFPLHVENVEVPAGRAPWPEEDDIHTLCPSCGRLYRHADIERDGEAPVIDKSTSQRAPIADAIQVHWSLG